MEFPWESRAPLSLILPSRAPGIFAAFRKKALPRRLSRHLVRPAANRHGKRGNLVFNFSADITFFRLASVDKQETQVN